MAAHTEPRTFSIQYPWVYQNTRMYPLNVDNPEWAFVLGEVKIPVDHPFPYHVGFCRACEERWELRAPWDTHGTVICPYKGKGLHGHLILVCDDGTAIMQTPIESIPMLEFVFATLVQYGTMSPLEADTAFLILKQDVKHLLTEMTESEQLLIRLKEVENEVDNLVWIS